MRLSIYKSSNTSKIALAAALTLASSLTCAWEASSTHNALMQIACDILQRQPSLPWLVGTPASNLGIANPWMKEDLGLNRETGIPFADSLIRNFLCGGVVDEDGDLEPIANWRVPWHFYDPTTDQGLTDVTFYQPSFESSLVWGYNSPLNEFDWKSAREKQWDALRSTKPAERLAAGLAMFSRIGSVAHLVQDLSQPQHARNDNHRDEAISGGSQGIEWYAHSNYGTALSILRGGVGSYKPIVPGPCDFRSLAEVTAGVPAELKGFWDTGKYRGQAGYNVFAGVGKPLVPSFTPGSGYGLAEISNYNNITTDTIFPKDTTYAGLTIKGLTTGNLYPYPNLTGTSLATVIGAGSTSIQRTRYIAPADKRFGWSFPGGDPTTFEARNFTNLAGNKVTAIGQSQRSYESVCKAMLPLAADYTAGLIQFFFRGQLEADGGPGGAESGAAIQMKNATSLYPGASALNSLSKGDFTLWQDNAKGNRSKVVLTVDPYGDSLPTQSSAIGYFFAEPWKGPYTVAFRGKVGKEDGAIAATSFRLKTMGVTADAGYVQDGFAISECSVSYSPYGFQFEFGANIPNYTQLRTTGGTTATLQVAHDGLITVRLSNIEWSEWHLTYSDFDYGSVVVKLYDKALNPGAQFSTLGTDSFSFNFVGRTKRLARTYSGDTLGFVNALHVVEHGMLDGPPPAP